MSETVRLDGRRALVTGAGRGIGLAVAERLASLGAALTLVARSGEALAAADVRARALGAPEVTTATVDLTDRDALAALCERHAGAVDVLVNNAGVARSAPLERTDDALWSATFALNVDAPFALTRAVLPGMVERGFGRVVNVGSTAALEGFAYTAAYCASKHALLGLTRAAAAEVRARHAEVDVTVNAVCPGFVDTAIVAESARRIATATGCTEEAARAQLGAMNPQGRLLAPAEVAERVVALALERPGVTNGAALTFERPPEADAD